MTAPRDSIVFNSGSGSDTAASGLGPATAVTGTGAAHTNGTAQTTITLTNTPDLSGVQAGDLLWLNTTSGRQYSIIASVDDGLDTVTVDDSFNIASGSAVDYAIGGKRATWDHADSRTIFADAKSGWDIVTETNQSITSSAIDLNYTSQYVRIRGDSGSTLRQVTQSAASVPCFRKRDRYAYTIFENLAFFNSNATKGACVSDDPTLTGAADSYIYFINCHCGEPAGSNNPTCFMQRIANYGLSHYYFCSSWSSGSYAFSDGAWFHELYVCCYDGGTASAFTYNKAGFIAINCVIQSKVYLLDGSYSHPGLFYQCTFEGSGSDAIERVTAFFGFFAINNRISNCSGYGFKNHADNDSPPYSWTHRSYNNLFWNNSSGNKSNFSHGQDEVTSFSPLGANTIDSNNGVIDLGFPFNTWAGNSNIGLASESFNPGWPIGADNPESVSATPSGGQVSTIRGGIHPWPKLPCLSPGTLTLDGTGDKIAFKTVCDSTTNIDRASIIVTSVSTPPTYQISLQAADANGDPDGTPLASTTSSSWSVGENIFSFSAAYTPTVGETYFIVVEYSSGTIGAGNNIQCVTGVAVDALSEGIPTVMTDTGAGWANVNTVAPASGWLHTDDTYSRWSFGFENITVNSFANNSTPDEIGNVFVSPITGKINGIAWYFDVSSFVDCTIYLYDSDNSVLGSISVDASDIESTSLTWLHLVFSSPISVVQGNTYRLTVISGSTSNIQVREQTFGSAAFRANMYPSFYMTERTDGGSWTDTTTSIGSIYPLYSEVSGQSTGVATTLTTPVFMHGPTSRIDTVTQFVIDASNEKTCAIYYACKAGTIDRVLVPVNSVATPPEYRVAVQGINASGDPDGTSATTQAFTPSAGMNLVTLSSPQTVAKGDPIVIVIEYSSGTITASNDANFAVAMDVDYPVGAQIPRAMTYNGSSWTAQNGVPCIGLLYDDGSNASFGCYPVYDRDQRTFNNGSTPDEIGNLFTATVNGVMDHVCYMPRWAGDMADATIYLYDSDDNVLATATVDYSDADTALFREYQILPLSASVTVTQGNDYRLTIISDSISNVNVYDENCGSSLARGLAWNMYKTSRTNSGTWTDDTTRVIRSLNPVYSQISKMTSTGGGGTAWYLKPIA